MKLENFVKSFERYDSRRSSFPGAMFVNIFNKIPKAYELYLDDKCELKYMESIDASVSQEKKDIFSKNPNRIFLNKFLKGALEEKNEYIKVVSTSIHEYIILNVKEDEEFLILIELGIPHDTAETTISIFCNDNSISNAIDIIKNWIVKYDKEDKIEFGIAAIDSCGNIYTSYYDYKYPNIDVDANYNDDLPYDKICNLIENEGMSELMLFYGDPGTGKTSLIKHFINKYPEKDFVFLDGSILVNAQQTSIMSYFLENQNTIFILEDCEKVLMSRDNSINPIMPILLNITDGIIGDVLGIKMICTFNTSLNNIDKALLRKGRLSLKYEFKALNINKAKKLAGDNADLVTKDMNLADIYYIKIENDYSKKKKSIGFG